MTITRGQLATLVTGTSSLTWATNPVAGQKVVIGIWMGAAEALTSAVDNGTSPSTFTNITGSPFASSDGHQVFILYADNITLPSAGSYTVTLTITGGTNYVAGGIAYTGVRSGQPTAINHGGATGTSVASGSVTPGAAGALYFSDFVDGSLISETITLTGSGFTQQFVEVNGVVIAPGAIADKIDAAGPTSTPCTWTLGDSVAWEAAIAVWDAATTSVSPLAQPGHTWTRQFRHRQQAPVPAQAPSFTSAAAVQGSGTLSGTIVRKSAGVSGVEGSGELSGTLAKNAVLTSAILGSGELAGLAAPVTLFDTLPAAPLFPAGYTNAMAELDLSGTWTDITPYAFRTPLTITRGHPDESTTTTPSQCTGTLANETGIFTGRNPLSAFYGSLMRNTPLRVSVPEGASYLRLEVDQASYAQGPSTGGVNITGDLDVQIDVTLDNWQVAQTLCCKWNQTGNERSWLLEMEDGGSLGFWVSPDGSSQSPFFSAAVPVPALGRQCLRVTYKASTATATFYTATPGLTGASWTLLGSALTYATSLSPFGCTAPVLLGARTDSAGYAGMYGKIHAFLLLSGIGGTQEASPDFTAQTAGATSFTDAQSNTWTLAGTSAVSNRKYLFHGELAALPQQWAPTFRQVWCDFTAAGVLRRLAQGTNPVDSAMKRAYVRLPSNLNLAAYWPAEDAAGATQIGQAVGNHAMTAAGLTMSSSSVFACSAPIPVMNGASATGTVDPNSVSWTDNVVRFLLAIPAAGDTTGVVATVTTTGTVATYTLTYTDSAGGTLTMTGYNAAGGVLFTLGPFTDSLSDGFNGQLIRVSMDLRTSGSNITYQWQTVAAGASFATAPSGTLSTATVGAVTGVTLNPGGALTTTAFGHVSVQGVWDSLFDIDDYQTPAGAFTGALNAWYGEPAGVRMQRLCGEEGIAFRGKGQLSASAPMGNQTLETLPQLLQECADTDRGIIFEPKQVLGLGYRCLRTLYNQTAAVAWDFDQDQMDMPTAWPLEDDQRTVNDVTVTAADGSTARQVVASGLMSVQLPPNGAGRYAQQYTVNPQNDSQLSNVAGWILHVGSVDEPRYPSIRADLANYNLTAAMFYAILDADLGDLTSGANPPLWLPPLTGTVRQLIQGSSLTLFTKQLTVDWACVPASPYDTAIIGDPVYGHLDTAGSTLTTGISSSALSMSVTTVTGPIWTTSAGDFPFDIQVNFGEIMTVTNITGASSPQTFTVTRGTNGVAVAHNSGEDIRLAHPMILAL